MIAELLIAGAVYNQFVKGKSSESPKSNSSSSGNSYYGIIDDPATRGRVRALEDDVRNLKDQFKGL